MRPKCLDDLFRENVVKEAIGANDHRVPKVQLQVNRHRIVGSAHCLGTPTCQLEGEIEFELLLFRLELRPFPADQQEPRVPEIS